MTTPIVRPLVDLVCGISEAGSRKPDENTIPFVVWIFLQVHQISVPKRAGAVVRVGQARAVVEAGYLTVTFACSLHGM